MSHEQNTLVFIDCEIGDLILPGLLGIMMGPIVGKPINQLVFHEMG